LERTRDLKMPLTAIEELKTLSGKGERSFARKIEEDALKWGRLGLWEMTSRRIFSRNSLQSMSGTRSLMLPVNAFKAQAKKIVPRYKG